MNEIKIFNNDEFGQIRTLAIENEPWFVGKDVADVLGYTKLDAMYRIVESEDKTEIDPQNIEIAGFPRNGATLEENPNVRRLILINESGLYSAIFNSKLPSAKKFKRWVTAEVLPAIRKHGAYMTADTIEKVLSDPDTIIKIATQLKEEKAKRMLLEVKVEEQKPKVIFADAVSASKTSILVGDMAKLLKQNGIDMGASRLFAWLRDNGFLIKRKGTDWNMPTQKSMELQLFEIKETSIAHSDGHTSISRTSKINGKGQLYFINKFLSGENERLEA